MRINTWLIYVLASTGLSLSPGPNGLLALTHSALHGSRKAIYTITGGVAGFVAAMALSMFGIGALLQASVGLLSVLRLLGGAYLVWLGIQIWRAPPITLHTGSVAGSANGTVLFRQGAFSALTNPKALLFFAAFLPQFIDPAHGLIVQFAIMAGTFAVIEFATEFRHRKHGAAHQPWLAAAGQRFNRACGGMFMAIGVALPLRG